VDEATIRKLERYLAESNTVRADLETEIQTLRQEVARLGRENHAEDRDPAGPITGFAVTIVGTADLGAEWERLILKAKRRISIAAFTFDSRYITDALCVARSRGGNMPLCRLLQDRAYYESNFMKNRGSRVARLRSLGVELRMHTVRRLHQKSLLADDILYLGSGNFTDATLQNVERGAIIALDAATAAEEQEAFDALWDAAIPG